jgi:hypothetical protein
LWLWLFVDSANKIFVEGARESIEPAPIVRERLEDDGIAVAPDANLPAAQAELLRKAYRL